MTVSTSPVSRLGLIFGREPAAWIAAVDVALVLGVSFGLPLTDAQTGVIIAFVTAVAGLFTAWAVQPTAPALFVAVAKSGITLVTAFGLHLAAGQQGAILSGLTVVLALVLRNQVNPPVAAVAAAVLPELPVGADPAPVDAPVVAEVGAVPLLTAADLAVPAVPVAVGALPLLSEADLAAVAVPVMAPVDLAVVAPPAAPQTAV